MKLLAVLFFLTLTSQSFARTLSCSTSNGDLRFSEISKSGGAAPFPGMLLSTTQWFYKNNIVFEKNTYQGLKQESESNITWNFQSESQVYVVNNSTGWSTHAIFAILIDLKSSDGQNMTGMEFPAFIDWFLCQEDDQQLP